MRLALGMLIIASIPCLALAGKKKETTLKGKDWNGPFIELRLSSRFARYLERYDGLMELKGDIDEIDNESKRKSKLDSWNDSLKDLREDLDKKIDLESRSFKRELATLEKKLADYDRKRERGGSEKAMERLEKEEAEAVARQKQINGAISAFNGFKAYCSGNRKAMESTAYLVMDMMPPPIKAKTIDGEDFDSTKVDGTYTVILFFSLENQDSMLALRDIGRMDGRKVHGKKVKVIFINVDRGADDAEKHKLELKKKVTNGATVLIDETNDLCAAYRVGFLPHAVLVDGDSIVRQVGIGPKARNLVDDKIESIEKSKRKR